MMNVENKSADEIEGNEKKLLRIEQAETAIENKTSHIGFRDAQLLLELRDEAASLDTTLCHEKERQANCRD
jgi:hypothetical protein